MDEVMTLIEENKRMREQISALKRKRRPHIIQFADISHTDGLGNLLYSGRTGPNMLHDEGEIRILVNNFATTHTDASVPANMYIGMDQRCSAPPAETGLTENNTLASLSGEPSTGGYARIANSTAGTGAGGQDFVLSQPSAAYRVTTKTCTFTHNGTGGSWTGMTTIFLCDVASGTAGDLYASVPMSQSRTIAAAESISITLYLGLSE
jgi:hypothetical protein